MDYPDASGNAHADGAICSNRGTCDRATGTCVCERGFTGEACERMECPNDCSGHGKCLTMREAARKYDGRTLFRKVRYDLWDADMVRGCVCDEGFSGFDCAQAICPQGSDPLAGGTVEAQTVRTQCTHRDEVQRIRIGGTGVGAEHEVQTFTVFGPLNAVPEFGGSFYVGFDTSGGDCNFCAVEANEEAEVEVETAGSWTDRATTTAGYLETALESLSNVDDVSVTGTYYVTGSYEGFTFDVTFTGDNVGGDVPTLTIDTFPGIPENDVDASTVTSVDGEEVSGYVQLLYDPTDERFATGDFVSFPSPDQINDEFQETVITTGAEDAVTIDVTATADEIKAKLESLDGVDADALDVSLEYTGGPGVNWLVTFARGERSMGNRALIQVNGTNLSPVNGFFAPNATSETVRDGTWVSGQFFLTLVYDGVTSTTPWMDWNVTAETVKENVEAMDSAVGVVRVTKTRHNDGDGGSDDWSGGYDWAITFLNIAENMEPMTVNHTIDCDPADTTSTTTGGGKARIAAESKTNEVQVFHTDCDHADTVQVITIDDTVNTAKAVQALFITTASGEPTGTFTLGLDLTGNGCLLCDPDFRTDEQTISIVIDSSGADTDAFAENTASTIQERLRNLGNIDNDLTVTGSTYSFGGEDGYKFLITFGGEVPAGDVPLLTVPTVDSTPAAWNTTVNTIVRGEEVSGTVTLTFNDTEAANYPLAEDQDGEGLTSLGSATSASISVTDDETAIKAALDAMGNLGTVTVSREFVGGPGIVWYITFSGGDRGRGQKALFDCDATSLLPAGDATCDVSRTTEGSFLRGSFRIRALFDTIIYETNNLDWDITADEMKDEVFNMVPDEKLGEIEVTRVNYEPSGEDDWVGGFEWAVTFLSLQQDLRTFGFRNDLYCLNNLQRGGAAVTFDTTKSTDGEAPGEVNEVQLLECTCDTCSGGVRLTWRGQKTSRILATATASEIQAAIEELDGIPYVTIGMLDDASGTLCDADGQTTAITFTHNPGDVPPLLVDPTDPVAITLASALSNVTFEIRTGDGEFEPRGEKGFKARKGTRVLQDCSGRGSCDLETSQCTCFTDENGNTLFGPSNNAGGEVDPSPADDRLGVANCGYPLSTVTTCPRPASANALTTASECSGRGTCSDDPDYRCTCPDIYTGPACEALRCPRSRAWFDEASETNKGHDNADCAGRGLCHPSGHCVCSREFSYNSTHCSELPCPTSGGGGVCSGAGVCVSMREMAAYSVTNDDNEDVIADATYTEWDADMVRGCACERHDYVGPQGRAFAKRSGWACDNAECVKTEDPRIDRSVGAFEVQTLQCDVTGTLSGTFTLTFRGYTTIEIPYNAKVLRRHDDVTSTAVTIQSALHDLPTLPRFNITLGDTNTDEAFDAFNESQRTFCGTAETVTLTILAPQGDLPEITADTSLLSGATISVTTVTNGTRIPTICSNRGVCDYSTGQCDCQPQFGSSDGDYRAGDIGDCANFDSLWKFGKSNARSWKGVRITSRPPARH